MTRHTIHIVSHTHWDREWYQTYQQFRLKLVLLMDHLLDLMESDPDYKHFMLDGQTIILDDYLEMRPEKEETLRALIQQGRILIGPWHILPDMFLVGAEAHIRNLLEGTRTTRRFGLRMPIGYIPDPFGHPGQLPQILRGFGMDTACLWRGVDQTDSEFWWEAPDGSRVLMAYLRDGYGNGASLPAEDPVSFASQLVDLAESLLPDATTSNLLVMYGTDHMEPPPETSRAIHSADQRLADLHVIHSTLPGYVSAVKQELSTREPALPVIQGELRTCRRMHLLPGVLSSRMWIKQRNRACEILLEKWVEPFTVFQESILPTGLQAKTIAQKAPLIRQVWRLLMENHPHDSICGCSIDQVHTEMKVRFDQVDQIGQELTRQSLETIAAAIDTSFQPLAEDSKDKLSEALPTSALVIFNPTAGSRRDVVTARMESPSTVEFDLVDEEGSPVPYQELGLGSHELVKMTMEPKALLTAFGNISDGRVAGMVIQDIQVNRHESEVFIEAILTSEGEPNLLAWTHARRRLDELLEDPSVTTCQVHASSTSSQLTFLAPQTPGFGYRTLWVCPRPITPSPPVRLNPLYQALLPLAKLPFINKIITRRRRARPPYRIESDLFNVEAQPDGTITLHDKRDGKVYPGLNQFLDGGDCGDEYNYAPPIFDMVTRPRLKRISIDRQLFQQVLELDLELETPLALSTERKTRSSQRTVLPIKTAITLCHSVPRVDIHTTIHNSARDHRLRVHFPAPFAVHYSLHDGHFEVVKRLVGVPAFDDTWVEQPRPEVPQQAFTSLTDGNGRLTIACRGLPEVEVLHNAQGQAEIALTLLRCVGWLSRDDFATRQGHAGPPGMETPEAQMTGKWEFDYAIFSGGGLSAYQEAYRFETPMRVISTGLHQGSLPASAAFLQIEPPEFVISAIKPAESGVGWVVRGHNLTGEDILVTLQPWQQFAKVDLVNLAEEKIGEVPLDINRRVTLPVRGHAIVSLLFRPS